MPVLRQVRPVQGESETARPQAHGRTAVRVLVLRPRVRREKRPDPAPAHSHRRAAVPLRDVRQVLRQGRLPIQAPDHAHTQQPPALNDPTFN